MESIGIGLIGTGFMGKCHALAFNAVKATFGDVPRPRLELLCDPNRATVERRARELGFARTTTDWREVVADPKVELVSITTPNALHRELATAALAAGKHVYCEKPMAATLDDARAMAAAARRAAGRTRLGYNYACNPAIAHARRLIESAAIGRVLNFQGIYDEDYMADPEQPWSWRCRRAEAGLGALGDLMVHLLSMAHLLIGRITRLGAEIETIHGSRPMPSAEGGARAPVENEDMARALVRFEGGASGLLTSSRIAWGRKCRLAWELQGSKGTLSFDQERMNELQLYVAEGEPATRGFRTILTGPAHPPFGAFCPAPGHGLGYNDLKVIEVVDFLRAIASGGRSRFDFEEGLAIERVIHGIAESAHRQAWIEIDHGADDGAQRSGTVSISGR